MRILAAPFNKKASGPKTLRYGENPHQKATFYGNLIEVFTQIHGKELSYNNLLDIDAAINLMAEFDETTFAVIKHNNACGIASRPSIARCMERCPCRRPCIRFWRHTYHQC